MATSRPALALATVALLALPIGVSAQNASPTFELGASLLSATFQREHSDTTTILGIPSSSLGIINPGVYGAIFLTNFVSVDPQVGLLLVSGGGETNHIVNVTGQVNLFLQPASRSAPYVFGAVGVMDTSGNDKTPKTYSGGIGYRMLAGGGVAVRVDGRYTHFSDDGGNAAVITIYIGGVLASR